MVEHNPNTHTHTHTHTYIYIYIKISINKILEKILVYLEPPTILFFSHSLLQNHFRLGAGLSPTHL